MDEQLGRTVAIKKLLDGHGDGPDQAKSRVMREARAMARLSHPHMVQATPAAAAEIGDCQATPHDGDQTPSAGS
ncbi:MAG: hypothetical protein K0V04_22155 [Deltaproteobacteria bacterium]|nr:hypothetical protein [Deltaproteobacteria bacterium]